MENLLENHIDAPIKRSVALLNLLGIETTFSCCGFNYKEAVVPKAHLLGRPQVMFLASAESIKSVLNIIHCSEFAAANAWLVMIQPREPYDKVLATIHCDVRVGGDWKDPNCPHFHEFSNRCLKNLEERLLQLKDKMVDEIIVTDYNHEMKKIYPYWQYDGCDPWTVKKADWI